ncbi:Fluoroacetate dehalogenase [Cercospora beticola]|uniref:Fluoroacetate dehalogenase n=1 Tax=Cercospora beticola TaxID=122368 RepID=A0A2G5I5F9_CERBT|nr:Fluoroacetate dehalogenase [Cercospora beticola]PIB00047.1 Fluoroacetate dehalogenase [Cercospora beticola]WPB00858.1 hypothetical protein RHO25_005478 [Cercospora beticola]CAK1360898.1 unnamed protein product [Cercospora beticola]
MAVPTNLSSLHPFLSKNETAVSSGGSVISYSHDLGSGPILVMVHGWPQTSYMWRHTAPLLKSSISMFIVELPGYGISSQPAAADKRTVGRLIVDAVHRVFDAQRPLIWCGHDRGGRVGHRLVVDNDPAHNIVSAIVMDIVPTLEQWRALTKSRLAIPYYHWPFLANEAAPSLIEQMGARNYLLHSIERMKTINPIGAARFDENDSIEHYAQNFSLMSTVKGSCADYHAGATVDVDEQEDDMREGRRIKVPLLVIYSARNLGSSHDVLGLWEKWSDCEVRAIGVKDDIGHFLPEEAPEETVGHIRQWIEEYPG